MKVFLKIFLIISLLAVNFFPEEADAKRRRHRRRAQRQKVINEKKLYERMGGNKVIAKLADESLRLQLMDPRLERIFRDDLDNKKIADLKKNFESYACDIADGPCAENDLNIKDLLPDKVISDTEALTFSENVLTTLEKLGIPEREKNEFMGRLGYLRNEVINPGSFSPAEIHAPNQDN